MTSQLSFGASVRLRLAAFARGRGGGEGMWGKILGDISPRNPIAVEECRVFALALALARAVRCP